MERHSKNELEWETSGERSVVEVVSQTLEFAKGGVIHISICFPFSIFQLQFFKA